MFTYETNIRVRYAETDQMAYVYYGNYATYYEVARVEAFRYLAFPYRELEEQGIMMPVLELHTYYQQPAKYDDLLTIKVRIPKLPAVRILFEYEIFNQSKQRLNHGSTTLVFVDMKNQRPKRCPQVLLEKLSPFFE